MGTNETFGIYDSEHGSCDVGTAVSFDPFSALAGYIAEQTSSAPGDEDGPGSNTSNISGIFDSGFGSGVGAIGLIPIDDDCDRDAA